MSRNLYMVAYDFTPAGDAAIGYGLHLAKYVRVELVILHVASSSGEISAKKQKLEKLVADLVKPNDCLVNVKVQKGSIFKTIASVAKEISAQLILLGTHGTTGMQKIFGSHVIKVITSSNLPFLIVQKDTVMTELEDIVMPVNSLKESLQISRIMGDLAVIFGSTVHIIAEKQGENSGTVLLRNRMQVIQKKYDERKIKNKLAFLENKGNYIPKILNYSKNNSIDLIGFAYYSSSLFAQFDKFADNLLMNPSKLPCLVIAAKEVDTGYF